MLKVEIYIFLMNAHLDQLQTSTKIRLRFEKHQTLIANACRVIVKKLRNKAKRRRDQKSISDNEKHSWTKQILQNRTLLKQSTLFFFWDDSRSKKHTKNETYNAIMRACQSLIKAKHIRVWFDSWAIYLREIIRSSMTQTDIINCQCLKMHQLLRKVESSLIIQIRSKKIDLTSFLFHRRVFDVFSSIYFCDWNQ
jgi:Skp family chaperone for outer membrane proteins